MAEFFSSVFSTWNCLFLLAVMIGMIAFGCGFLMSLAGTAWTAACMIIMQLLWMFLPHIVVLIGMPIYFIISIKLGKGQMAIVNIPLILIYIGHFFSCF